MVSISGEESDEGEREEKEEVGGNSDSGMIGPLGRLAWGGGGGGGGGGRGGSGERKRIDNVVIFCYRAHYADLQYVVCGYSCLHYLLSTWQRPPE